MKIFAAKINSMVNCDIAWYPDTRRNSRGQLDYWQAAHETVLRGKGDCEDFAILKMKMLQGIVPDEQLRLVHVLTEKRESHMVLGVSLDDDPIFLDCQHDHIFKRSKSNYAVLYTIGVDGRVYDPLGGLSESRILAFDTLATLQSHHLPHHQV